MTAQPAETLFDIPHPQSALIISRQELADIIGFRPGQLNTLINAGHTHAFLREELNSASAQNYVLVDENQTVLMTELEEVFFMRDEPDGDSKSFWLQLHVKGITNPETKSAYEPIMCVLCEPMGNDYLKLSHAWLKPILNNRNEIFNRDLFYRPILGNKHIEAFEALVRRVAGKNLQPDYTPPRSPRYTP